jgi:15-cis-phytoene synthase
LKKQGYHPVNLDFERKIVRNGEMIEAENDLSPPTRLAIAYAPRGIRPSFALLLKFDARFAGVIGNASEPLIGQMKLAWWRDAVRAGASENPKGEPMLSALFAFDQPILTKGTGALIDAWEILVADPQWSASTVQDFAQARGEAIARAYSALCGRGDFSADAMTQWAIADLRLRFGSRVSDVALLDSALPAVRVFRPLTILAMSVRQVSGPRLIWHALTGR